MYTEQDLDATMLMAEQVKANIIKKYETEEQEYVEYAVILE